jgi:hypothetical protein
MGLMRNYPRVMTDPYAMPTFTQLYWSPSAVATLAAGYVGSAVVGFLLVVSMIIRYKLTLVLFMYVRVKDRLTSVHIVASKVCALVLHFALLVPVLRADHWM